MARICLKNCFMHADEQFTHNKAAGEVAAANFQFPHAPRALHYRSSVEAVAPTRLR